MIKSCSCIIPFRNEETRIGKVLKEVIKVKKISQIIGVDGASTDQSYYFVKKNFPQVELVRMKKNLGKTEAVKEGMKRARGDYILLLDADLLGVKKDELEFVITNMLQRPEIDMLILKRTKTPFLSRLIRSDLVFSGERIIKKNDLKKILDQPLTKYQLEIAANKYMIDNKKTFYWFQASTENTPKVKKENWLTGYWKELKMKANVISYDPIGYHWQILFFCRQRAPF